MSLLTDISERFRALFRREQVDREFDDELAFHIEQDVAERVGRGIDPGEARRQAIVALGGVAQVTEQVRDARGVRPFEDLAGDVRHAVRLFWASPFFALTVIAVLGGALGATIALFAVADTTTFSHARYGITARLVRIYESNSPTNRCRCRAWTRWRCWNSSAASMRLVWRVAPTLRSLARASPNGSWLASQPPGCLPRQTCVRSPAGSFGWTTSRPLRRLWRWCRTRLPPSASE